MILMESKVEYPKGFPLKVLRRDDNCPQRMTKPREPTSQVQFGVYVFISQMQLAAIQSFHVRFIAAKWKFCFAFVCGYLLSGFAMELNSFALCYIVNICGQIEQNNRISGNCFSTVFVFQNALQESTTKTPQDGLECFPASKMLHNTAW